MPGYICVKLPVNDQQIVEFIFPIGQLRAGSVRHIVNKQIVEQIVALPIVSGSGIIDFLILKVNG